MISVMRSSNRRNKTDEFGKEWTEMKKILTLIFAISMIWTFQGCSQQTAFDIGITIPAHTTKDFVYQEDFTSFRICTYSLLYININFFKV